MLFVRNNRSAIRKTDTIAWSTSHNPRDTGDKTLLAMFVENDIANTDITHCSPPGWGWYECIKSQCFPVPSSDLYIAVSISPPPVWSFPSKQCSDDIVLPSFQRQRLTAELAPRMAKVSRPHFARSPRSLDIKHAVASVRTWSVSQREFAELDLCNFV
jgi:hypothetical protein